MYVGITKNLLQQPSWLGVPYASHHFSPTQRFHGLGQTAYQYTSLIAGTETEQTTSFAFAPDRS